MLRLDLAMSFGNWKYTSDVNAKYRDYSNPNFPDQEFNLYTNGLKVGDQPQTALALTATLFPVEGLSVSGIVRHYRQHYAALGCILTRTNANDRQQSWQAPNYTVIDLHAVYNLPLNLRGVDFQLFGHVFNLLDEIYVQDATDNSAFNAYAGNGKTHSADDAEVYLGLPQII